MVVKVLESVKVLRKKFGDLIINFGHIYVEIETKVKEFA